MPFKFTSALRMGSPVTSSTTVPVRVNFSAGNLAGSHDWSARTGNGFDLRQSRNELPKNSAAKIVTAMGLPNERR